MFLLDWWERRRSRLLVYRLDHGGLRRHFLLYVPRHHLGRGPLPVVMALHGGAGNPQAIARATRLHELAAKKGFIVVYPAGTSFPGALGLGWNAAESFSRQPRRDVDDVDFLRHVLATVRREYEIDPDRIYAAGMSLGGMMAYRLACQMSDKLAAIACVAGTMTTTACDPVRPVSILHIHGSADLRVPFRGGRGPRTHRLNSWPPVEDGIIHWRKINRCETRAETGLERPRVRRWTYRGDADVELCLIENGRHVWPGKPRGFLAWLFHPGAGQFSATEKIWRFFEDHPRPPRK